MQHVYAQETDFVMLSRRRARVRWKSPSKAVQKKRESAKNVELFCPTRPNGFDPWTNPHGVFAGITAHNKLPIAARHEPQESRHSALDGRLWKREMRFSEESTLMGKHRADRSRVITADVCAKNFKGIHHAWFFEALMFMCRVSFSKSLFSLYVDFVPTSVVVYAFVIR